MMIILAMLISLQASTGLLAPQGYAGTSRDDEGFRVQVFGKAFPNIP